MTQLEKRSTLPAKIFVKRGNKPKLIKLLKTARELEEKQNKLQKEFIKLTYDELEDFFWDCVYSIYPVDKDLEDLFTSKRIGWK